MNITPVATIFAIISGIFPTSTANHMIIKLPARLKILVPYMLSISNNIPLLLLENRSIRPNNQLK